MIKRHAFSFSGWIITLLFALAWRHNVKERRKTEKEVNHEELIKGDERIILILKFCFRRTTKNNKNKSEKTIFRNRVIQRLRAERRHLH